MGWTVLYIAFGVVALWLLGEVLLQYKARLRWRLLAFGGFLGVVLGVLIGSVVVIALGAIAFATGQTYVTLSFRRGFSTGWAIGGRPGASRRRKSGDLDGREPALVVSGVEETAPSYAQDFPPFDAPLPGSPDSEPVYEPLSAHQDPEPVYEPQPMPDDTNGYGVYTGGSYEQDAQDRSGQGGPGGQGGDESYGGPYDPYYGGGQPGGQDGFGADPQQYEPYAAPYTGGQQYNPFEGYDSFGNPQQYDTDPYYAQQQQSLTDTPPGGVWVPQQRDTEEPGQDGAQQQQPSQQQYGFDAEYDDKHYRY
ncbi:hypothetical protein [Streptomyces katsurahamanus]|uniref:DUF456 domain-containing protein n=1 Tax=Streptomyces katsurahamanus TaxID=2577098 RepID=A0ABW9NQK9_9ACTN|nr:hypothetical protein [Streptomyces katsurahamanus]MQS35199.1 DUF456 domain-containing protein [Streptomyces katsurahamanus]